ncbi:hypothetical protein Fcan01_01493 [Folsomia candida]|uniref:Uncharacterized protein n=1 Tax=Folsomia candida TaxID=158441 RepID=A0A226EX41_FOLCA|nr:hypothetical protein Fcan01_01493 [Folsomia candida]
MAVKISKIDNQIANYMYMTTKGTLADITITGIVLTLIVHPAVTFWQWDAKLDAKLDEFVYAWTTTVWNHISENPWPGFAVACYFSCYDAVWYMKRRLGGRFNDGFIVKLAGGYFTCIWAVLWIVILFGSIPNSGCAIPLPDNISCLVIIMALYFRTITFASCRYFEFTAAYGSAEGQIVSPGKKNEERGKTEV